MFEGRDDGTVWQAPSRLILRGKAPLAGDRCHYIWLPARALAGPEHRVAAASLCPPCPPTLQASPQEQPTAEVMEVQTLLAMGKAELWARTQHCSESPGSGQAKRFLFRGGSIHPNILNFPTPTFQQPESSSIPLPQAPSGQTTQITAVTGEPGVKFSARPIICGSHHLSLSTQLVGVCPAHSSLSRWEQNGPSTPSPRSPLCRSLVLGVKSWEPGPSFPLRASAEPPHVLQPHLHRPTISPFLACACPQMGALSAPAWLCLHSSWRSLSPPP